MRVGKFFIFIVCHKNQPLFANFTTTTPNLSTKIFPVDSSRIFSRISTAIIFAEKNYDSVPVREILKAANIAKVKFQIQTQEAADNGYQHFEKIQRVYDETQGNAIPRDELARQ